MRFSVLAVGRSRLNARLLCVFAGLLFIGLLLPVSATTAKVNVSVSSPPRPSRTRTATVCEPICDAVGVQLMRPVALSIDMPSGACVKYLTAAARNGARS